MVYREDSGNEPYAGGSFPHGGPSRGGDAESGSDYASTDVYRPKFGQRSGAVQVPPFGFSFEPVPCKAKSILNLPTRSGDGPSKMTMEDRDAQHERDTAAFERRAITYRRLADTPYHHNKPEGSYPTLWEQGHIVDKGRARVEPLHQREYNILYHHPVPTSPAPPSASSPRQVEGVHLRADKELQQLRGKYDPITHTPIAPADPRYEASRQKDYERSCGYNPKGRDYTYSPAAMSSVNLHWDTEQRPPTAHPYPSTPTRAAAPGARDVGYSWDDANYGARPEGHDTRYTGNTGYGGRPAGYDTRPAVNVGGRPAGYDARPAENLGGRPAGYDARPAENVGGDPRVGAESVYWAGEGGYGSRPVGQESRAAGDASYLTRGEGYTTGAAGHEYRGEGYTAGAVGQGSRAVVYESGGPVGPDPRVAGGGPPPTSAQKHMPSTPGLAGGAGRVRHMAGDSWGTYDPIAHIWKCPPTDSKYIDVQGAKDRQEGLAGVTRGKVASSQAHGVYNPILNKWTVPPTDPREARGLSMAPASMFVRMTPERLPRH